MKPIDILLDKASKIEKGEGEPFEDWRDALEIYSKAIQLGSVEAYHKTGELLLSLKGKNNIEKAILNYKQALRLGYLPSAAALALVYEANDEQDSSIKMWQYFFKNFSLQDNNSEIMLEFAFKYIQLSFDSKQVMNELTVFKAHYKEFVDFFRRIFDTEVTKKLPLVQEKIELAKSNPLDYNLLAIRKEFDELEFKNDMYKSLSLYFTACLSGKKYEFS